MQFGRYFPMLFGIVSVIYNYLADTDVCTNYLHWPKQNSLPTHVYLLIWSFVISHLLIRIVAYTPVYPVSCNVYYQHPVDKIKNIIIDIHAFCIISCCRGKIKIQTASKSLTKYAGYAYTPFPLPFFWT